MRLLQATAVVGLVFATSVTAQEGYESHYFDSDGVRLHYLDEGDGPAVLLVHGLGVSVAMNWTQPGIFQRLVDEGYRVVAYDGRGHGLSEKLHDPAAYGTVEIDDAVRLLDHLGIDRAHVVGYSRGGALAMRIRALHPARVASVTIGGYAEGAEERLPEGAPASSLIADSMEAGTMRPLIRWLIPGLPPEELESLDRGLSGANDLQAVAEALRAMVRLPPVSPDELDTGEVPALALVGGDDVFRNQVEAMAKSVEGMELIVVPGATHTDLLYRPEIVTGILGFLDKQTRATDRRAAPSAPGPTRQPVRRP